MPSNPKTFISKFFSTNHRILLEKRLKFDLLCCIGKTLVLGAGHDPYRPFLRNAGEIITNDIDSSLSDIDIVSSAEDLPLSCSSLDSVVAIEVFEHVKNIDACISECTRLLKPGGILYITMPFMFHIHGDPNDYRRLTIPGIKLLLDTNFKVSKCNYYGNIFHVLLDTLSSGYKIMRLIRPVFQIASLLQFKSNKFPSGVTVIAVKK